MSPQLFSVNNPVTRCACRRSWGGTVLAGLMLIGLVALCGWLWCCVREASGQTWRLGDWETGGLVAMAPPSVPLVVGITAAVMTGLMWWAIAAVRENERWIEELRRNSEWIEPFLEGKEEGGIPPEDLRRIVGAMVVETHAARELVRKSRTALEEAEHKLHMVIGCLGGLMERCDGAIAQEKGGSL